MGDRESTVISGNDATSLAGDGGYARTGAGGLAAAGRGGTAEAGLGGAASVGIGGEIRLAWRDSYGRKRTTVLYPGENAIHPNTLYEVDHLGKPMVSPRNLPGVSPLALLEEQLGSAS